MKKTLFAMLLLITIALSVTVMSCSGEVKQDSSITSVTVSPTTLSLSVGESSTLTATVLPASAAHTVTWSSSNTAVATVEDGVVKAIAEGSATITATAGGKTGSCTVSVSAEGKYLCFTAREAGVTISMDIGDVCPEFIPTLYYKTNSDWDTYIIGTIITLDNDEEVYFRAGADGNYYFASYDEDAKVLSWCQFFTKGSVDISGNIMYLLDENANKTTLSDCCFQNLFSGCSIVNAKDLSLPVETLTRRCYEGMFGGCTSLTDAPSLPATTLAERCYESMFEGCEKLEKAPELPVENLADYCYSNMFYNCKGLTEIPVNLLPAKELADGCYKSMFCLCAGLTKTPELPATTLTDSCYYNMFGFCSKLTTVSDMKAETLAESCCELMFRQCSKLSEAPKLQAETLAKECYKQMFESCTSLTSAPKLPATTLANGCYQEMFLGCMKLNVKTDATGATLIFYCPSIAGLSNPVTGMFSSIGTEIGTPESGKTYYWYIPSTT